VRKREKKKCRGSGWSNSKTGSKSLKEGKKIKMKMKKKRKKRSHQFWDSRIAVLVVLMWVL
jgi:hypothetical protein